MEFKENLKQLRIKNGLTQAQLAEKLFVSRSTVAKWENGLGLPNPDSMAELEKLFGIGETDLATNEPEKVIINKNQNETYITLYFIDCICFFVDGMFTFSKRTPICDLDKPIAGYFSGLCGCNYSFRYSTVTVYAPSCTRGIYCQHFLW